MIRDGASNNKFSACISDGCEAGVSFILTGEDADYCGENNTFENCIFKNARWVVDLNPYEFNSASADNNLWVNCVIDNADYLFNSKRPNKGNEFKNCIIENIKNYSTGDQTVNFSFSYNDFYNNGFSSPAGEGNFIADPQFISAEDYHLTATSPCIDSGTEEDAPKYDFEGTQRPQGAGYDIGIYEYVGKTGNNSKKIEH